MCKIGSLYRDGRIYYFSRFLSYTARGYIWYELWVTLFKYAGISSPFLWLKIIHVVQFIFVGCACYFYSYSLLKILLKKSSSAYYRGRTIKYSAFFAVIFWFTGVGFPSVGYHNTWIAWYSLNYQCLSMGFFWLGIGLLLSIYNALFPVEKSNLSGSKKYLLIFLLFSGYLICAFFIILIHPLEIIYLFTHSLFLAIAFSARLFTEIKSVMKKILVFVFSWIIFAGILYYSPLFITTIANKYQIIKYSSSFFKALKLAQAKKWDILYTTLIKYGTLAVGTNKWPLITSELFFISCIIAGMFVLVWPVLFFIWRRSRLRKSLLIDLRIFLLYLLPVSIFICFVLNFKLPAGVIASAVPPTQLYRFFFAIPWFVFIPFFVSFLFMFLKYFIYERCGKKWFVVIYSYLPLIYTAGVLLFVISLFFMSFHFTRHKVFYKNIMSMKRLLFFNNSAFNYTYKDIQRLKAIADSATKGIKHPMIFIRGDAALILNYFYGYDTLCIGKWGLIVWNKNNLKNYINRYRRKYRALQKEGYKNFKDKIFMPPDRKIIFDYSFVPISLPPDFPRDEVIFRDFPRLDRWDSCKINVRKHGGVIGEITGNTTIVQSFKGIKSIARIQLLMANYCNRENTKDIILQIKDKPDSNKSLAEIKVNASDIDDNTWHTFKLPNYLCLNPKHTYYLVITSPDSYPGNAVTIYKTDKDRYYKKGELFINGKRTGVDLCFRIWSEY